MNTKSVIPLMLGIVLSYFAYGQAKPFNPETYVKKEFPLSDLQTLDNKRIGIDELKGKPSLINFWFTSCKPCIAEMPELNKLKSRFLDSVNFIAITFESKGKVLKFLETHEFDFIQVANAKNFIDKLGMKAYPVNIFLDKNGVLASVTIGMPYLLDENKNPTIPDGRDFHHKLMKLLSDQ